MNELEPLNNALDSVCNTNDCDNIRLYIIWSIDFDSIYDKSFMHHAEMLFEQYPLNNIHYRYKIDVTRQNVEYRIYRCY